MNIEIVKKYAINFQNKIEAGIVEKFFNSNFSAINLMFVECNLSDIDDYNNDDGLLTQIDKALANSDSEIESGCGIVPIIIYQDVVKFYITMTLILCQQSISEKSLLGGGIFCYSHR